MTEIEIEALYYDKLHTFYSDDETQLIINKFNFIQVIMLRCVFRFASYEK